MSVIATIAGLMMILISQDPTIHGTGVSIILAVNGYWFVSGAAKQVATEVVKQVQEKPTVTVPLQAATQKVAVSLEPVDMDATQPRPAVH